MLYYILAVVAGMTLTSQVGVNGKLLAYTGGPLLTSLLSFFVGTVGLGLVYLLSVFAGWQAAPNAQLLSKTALWMWSGGLIGAFYVLSTVLIAPKIGFANMFSLIVAGQIILAVVFDHFGLLTGQAHMVSPLRLLGIAFLIIGVYLVQTN